MSDDTIERRRAEEMAETLKHDVAPLSTESLPTSAGAEPIPFAPASNPIETKRVRCYNCLQEHDVPADAKEFTCKVCGELNQLDSKAHPGTIHTE